MSQEYIEAFNSFFQERLKSQTKTSYKVCDGCKDKKQFTIQKDKLIYSCGSKSGKCGPQMSIDLEKCIYFPDMKEEIYKANDHYEYNNKLEDLFTKEELSEIQTLKKQRKDLLKYNQKLFTKINNHKKREESIKKLHKDRCKDKQELIILKDKINNETNQDKKNTLLREYIQINKRMNTEYKEMLEVNQYTNNFIPIYPGKVSSINKESKDSFQKT